MTRRLVPTHLSYGQLCLFEEINARESPEARLLKKIVRPEFIAGALAGLLLGVMVSVHLLSTQANGLAVAARIGLSAYRPPSSQTEACK